MKFSINGKLYFLCSDSLGRNIIELRLTESAPWRCSGKKAVLKNIFKIYKKAPVPKWVFFVKILACQSTILLNGESGKSIFLWIFQTFLELLFTEHFRAAVSEWTWMVLIVSTRGIDHEWNVPSPQCNKFYEPNRLLSSFTKFLSEKTPDL